MTSISKILSANDIGKTGGHQAGILIPKNPDILNFFPRLNPEFYNPRVHLFFEDYSSQQWEFAFIYYNNKLFGKTRNEFRLTRMTEFLSKSAAEVGDELILQEEDFKYYVSVKRKADAETGKNKVLKLGGGWRVIDLGKKL